MKAERLAEIKARWDGMLTLAETDAAIAAVKEGRAPDGEAVSAWRYNQAHLHATDDVLELVAEVERLSAALRCECCREEFKTGPCPHCSEHWSHGANRCSVHAPEGTV